MNRVAVTIVDFMAFLVPGVVLLFALVLFPWPVGWLNPLNDRLLLIPLLNNDWAAGTCWILAAYILGFMLRLTSIELMNILTAHRWVARVRKESELLAPALESAINDDEVVSALKELARLGSPRGVGSCSPYFHFAKRVIRTRPELWVEAERLEAEIRLGAGLFVPFLLLAFGGLLRICEGFPSFVLIGIGTCGATIIIRTFPTRRVKEVLHDHFLALIALRHPNPNTPVSIPTE